MSVIGSNVLAGASGQAVGEYQIDRSLRFNSADSAYLSRTPSSASNRKTFTISCWIKRGKIPTTSVGIMSARSSGNGDFIRFSDESPNNIRIRGEGTHDLRTNAIFRDPSAWYHMVVAYDTTQSTQANRIKLYINGEQITDFAVATYPSQNADLRWNSTEPHEVGRIQGSNYFDGYLAEVHLVDGQALAPTDFGETDSDNNWNPKAYSGTYGTNGFHLDFADPADLGDDNSGNGNDWTPNNLVGSAGLETANQGFDVVTWTGNGSSRSITGLNFQPDFVWIKPRSAAYNNALFDIVRGSGKRLKSNETAAEDTDNNTLSGFNSDGFSLGTNNGVNQSSVTYVAWCWKGGGSASSNTDGTITSSVSANTTYGFSIVSWTGNGTSGSTVGHGLNAAPKMIIFKNRDTAGTNWRVYNTMVDGSLDWVYLNTTAAKSDSGLSLPTSTTFTAGGSADTNGNGNNMIAYCWSEVSGFSKFGSWTGNGSTTGPIVTTGFKPRFLLWKRSDSAANWAIVDSARSTSNPRDEWLGPNSSSAESANNAAYAIDFLDDGFQIKATHEATNVNGGTYIYAAFAAKPDGSIIDSLIDTPTNYDAASGNNGGNYATINSTANAGLVLSNGNLDFTGTGNAAKSAIATLGASSGKWYFEGTVVQASSGGNLGFGVQNQLFNAPSGTQPHDQSYGWIILTSGSSTLLYKYHNGSASSIGNYAAGDVLSIAVDVDAGKIWFAQNGTWVSSGNPATGANATYTNFSGTMIPYAYGYNTSDVGVFNFGQRPFAYTPPTGYKSLCTQNLSDPTIADGSTAFDTKLWTGDGTTSRAITGLNFSPDFLWIKSRSAAGWHALADSVRGAGKILASNATNSEYNNSDSQTAIESFDSNGFTIGHQNGWVVNSSSTTIVGWAWDAGTSTVSNTDGSITSSVRANASAGFSIVTYTGNNTTSTVGHGLNATPSLVIVKSRSATSLTGWMTRHSSLSSTYNLALNLADAAWNPAGNGYVGDLTSSTTFSLVNGSTNGNNVNQNGVTYVAYCFAPVEGYSAFGSYTGNGSTDGPFVYTGFRPKWILIKRTGAAASWVLHDTERSTYNVSGAELLPNDSGAEYTYTRLDFLSNGFKARTTEAASNTSGNTYVYAAFAEHPFKYSRAR